MTTYGFVLGRFQPFHLGHSEFVREAKEHCDRLCIGVTNPDLENRQYSPQDPKRSLSSSNPFSYYDRARMIEETLWSWGWTATDFMIVAAPIGRLETLAGYLPPAGSAVFLATIYDEWGEEKVKRLESLGYRAEVLWRRTYAERLTSGSEVRNLIRADKDWEHLVPGPVAAYLKDRGLLTQLME